MRNQRFCPQCGDLVSASDRFCSQCGCMVGPKGHGTLVPCARCKGTGKRYLGYTGLWARTEEDVCPACDGSGVRRV